MPEPETYNRWLVNEFRRTVPDVPLLRERIVESDFWTPYRGEGRPSILGAVVGSATSGVSAALVQSYVEEATDTSLRAIAKIEQEGADADLTQAEARQTEAIIAVWTRPAIFIQNGRFFPPPDPWEILEEHRDAIQRVIPSVGRVQLTGHPRLDWVGTAFLVADGVAMTNRHVAKEFGLPRGSGWRIEDPYKVSIDFMVELSSGLTREFPVTSIIGVHPELDLALLELKGDKKSLPPPLILNSSQSNWRKGRYVFIVGYPAADAGRNDPIVMTRVFNDVYQVKRLQPGKIMEAHPKQRSFDHDCSTLGGNSGSCVVDLDTNMVVGLHYRGRYQKSNQAIAIGELREDPMLGDAGLKFA